MHASRAWTVCLLLLSISAFATLAVACADRDPAERSASGLSGDGPGASPEPAREPVPPAGDAAENAPPVTPLHTVAPEYPESAKQAGLTGSVLVEVVVGPEGTVQDAKVKEAKGDPVLAEAALAAARRWTFEPRGAGAAPVAVAIPFEFKLDGHPAAGTSQ